METVGKVLTVSKTEAIFVLLQPAALVPFTEYVPVTVGEKGVPLLMPPDQVYVDAPEPFNEIEFPKQTAVLEPALIVGLATTVMVTGVRETVVQEEFDE